LRLTDEQIKDMQTEIDDEKEAGLGLPVGVMNDVTQQQMMSQVPQQPMNPADQQDAQQTDQQKESTILKLKRIL
jgi:hypothetical protein